MCVCVVGDFSVVCWVTPIDDSCFTYYGVDTDDLDISPVEYKLIYRHYATTFYVASL